MEGGEIDKELNAASKNDKNKDGEDNENILENLE